MRVFRGASAGARGPLAAQGGSWRLSGRPKSRGGLGRAAREALQKCVVTHFDARGPRGPLEAWGCAAAGALGALWNPGDAF